MRYTRGQRIVFMICLIVAGEAMFALPFHVARFFRPTVLSVLGFSATELGAVQAVYGVTAMLAYFPGGPLADLFEARKLLTVSLMSTGAGGWYFATFPPYRGMWVLFAFWGVSTILFAWAAMIRATREIGGDDQQGRAYGVLDGGRGLFAAVMATGAAMLFALVFPADPASVTPEQRRDALRTVIHAYTVVTMGAGVLVWFLVPRSDKAAVARPKRNPGEALRNVIAVVRLPTVWLQALIVVSAYVAYKGFDNYSLFAKDAYGMGEVAVGSFTAKMQWIRPVAALGAGLVADRFGSSRTVLAAFATLIGCDLYFAMATPVPSATWILFANVAVTCTAMFGLRGIYFALFQEASVPMAATGTAVGLVSLVGYTPDIFVALVAGILVDRTPGIGGHQHFFWFLTAFAVIGLFATLAFVWLVRRGGAAQPTSS
jgi:nitrate/nitrite transporter NarK